jgi:hypothetical protein
MTDEQMQIQAQRIRDNWMNHDSAQPGQPQPRPLGLHDVAPMAALNFRNWAPSDADYTREQRGRLRRLRQELRNPDLSGLSGPSDEDYKEFPQLRELAKPSALVNPKR